MENSVEIKTITFEDIRKANEAIGTIDVKGKQYAEVNQRIKAFRMVYPTGAILTEMVSNENGICVFRAKVYDEEDNLIATGTAYEKENSTFINKTSYIENCETSAIGRALGIAGFGIDTSVASAEEVQNAIANQEEIKKSNNKKLELMVKLGKLIEEKQVDREKLYEYYKVKDNADMSVKQLEEAIKTLEERK